MQKDLSKYTDVELSTMIKGSHSEQQAAFAEIYSRYSQKLYLYCYKILESSEEAADIYQDVFLKFVTFARNDSKQLTNIFGYLLRIARNSCINIKRQASVRRKYTEEPEFQKPANYGRKQLLDLIDEELQKMEYSNREVFILRLYQGLSYNEIGKICGISENAAKNKFWRTKDKLKEALGPYMMDLEQNL